MLIREFALADYDSVVSLWKLVGLSISPSDSVTGIKKKLKRDPDLFIVAEDAGEIIGVVLGAYDGRRGWINHLAVAPKHRHRGLGSTLLNEVEARLRTHGCEKVNLLISPDSSSVQGFYDRLCYSRDELVFMEKWLIVEESHAE